MKLPIARAAVADSPATLWRRFSELLFDHTVTVGRELSSETEPLPAGWRAIVDEGPVARQWGSVAIWSAHAEEIAGHPQNDFQEIVSAFARAGAVPPHRVLLPSIDAADAASIEALGYRSFRHHLLRMRASPATTSTPLNETIVVPARAARVAYGRWCDHRSTTSPSDGLLPAHLDDPQYEATVALRRGSAVAVAALQTRGQTGLFVDVFVDPVERRKGLAKLLLGRITDIAGRAQLADIFAAVPVADERAMAVFAAAGFVATSEFIEWRRVSEV